MKIYNNVFWAFWWSQSDGDHYGYYGEDEMFEGDLEHLTKQMILLTEDQSVTLRPREGGGWLVHSSMREEQERCRDPWECCEGIVAMLVP